MKNDLIAWFPRERRRKVRYGHRALRRLSAWAMNCGAEISPGTILGNSPLGFWHTRLPFFGGDLDGRCVPKNLRKSVVEQFISGAAEMKSHCLSCNGFETPLRVVCMIELPCLTASNITIFTNDSYVEKFIHQGCRYKNWTLLPPQRDLPREWGLALPTQLPCVGIEQTFHRSDTTPSGVYRSELWFFGDVLDFLGLIGSNSVR